MKILYVEDEITLNITRTKELFGGLLGNKKREFLETLETTRRKTAGQVKQLLESSGVIHVATSFSEALQEISNREFDLYIVDRNLNPDEEEMARVKEIDPAFVEDEYLESRYPVRQGDYIFSRLLHSGILGGNNFFFLSGYSFDGFKEQYGDDPEIAAALRSRLISKDNHIDKADSNALSIIIERIKSFGDYQVQRRYSDYFSALSDIGFSSADLYIGLLQTLDKDEVGSLNDIRTIYEEFMTRSYPKFKVDGGHLDKVTAVFGQGKNSCGDSVARTTAISLWNLTGTGSHFAVNRYTEAEKKQAFAACMYLLQLLIARTAF